MVQRWTGWLVAGLALLALGCSQRPGAGDAAAGVDAVDAAAVDALGDGAEGAGEDGGDGLSDAVADAGEVEEIADAISDAILEVADVDVAEVDSAAEVTDVPDVIADIPDVPLPSDCTGDALLPPPDATVLTDVGPLVPNKVVTGCGKGKPEPVAQGTECCDCPPPYSCYCNGECAWLRTPDLNVPHSTGTGVWTGKWVLAMTNYFVGFNEKLEAVHKVAIERWNPESTKGFVLSKHPEPDLLEGHERLFVVGGKVVVTTEQLAPTAGSGLGPDRPAYWYDPETDKYEAIAMPKCSGLVATATHLACCDGGFGGDKGAVHLYDVAAKSWSKVKAPEALLPAGQSLCWGQFERLIADEGNLYFTNPIWPGSSSIWPDGSINKNGGHILRYDLVAKAWKDLGAVPPVLSEVGQFVLRFGDGILFVNTEGGLTLGLFDLATGKTTISKSKEKFMITGNILSLDCGAFIDTALYWGPVVSGGLQDKYSVPAFIHPDLSMEPFPNWGFPSDDRGIATVLKTDKDLLVLGGYNGGYQHKDGYRYPISQICKGVKP